MDAAVDTAFDVTTYHLALRPDVAAKTVTGRETIRLRAPSGQRRLVFPANALTIDRAEVGGVAAAVDTSQDSLAVVLPRPIALGRSVKVKLTYQRLARGFAGSGTTLYTSYVACDWMVCVQDAFGDKAAFSLDLTVPRDMDSLAVGRIVTRRRAPHGGEVQRHRRPATSSFTTSWKRATRISKCPALRNRRIALCLPFDRVSHWSFHRVQQT